MGGPTGGAGDGEDGGEEVGGDAEAVVDGGGVEVHVGFEAFLFAHDFGDAFGHFDPLGFAEFIGEFDGHAAEVGGPGVEDLIDAVPDAHDLFFALEFSGDVFIDFFFVADFEEHIDHAFIGAAVEGAFEGADGGSDGGVEIGECRDGDASGEGGGIHAVVGVDDVGDVECFGGVGSGFFSRGEPEEVGGFGKVFADFGEVFTLAGAVVVGDDERNFRADRHGAFLIEFRILVFAALVVGAEHGDGGAKDVHGGTVFWSDIG